MFEAKDYEQLKEDYKRQAGYLEDFLIHPFSPKDHQKNLSQNWRLYIESIAYGILQHSLITSNILSDLYIIELPNSTIDDKLEAINSLRSTIYSMSKRAQGHIDTFKKDDGAFIFYISSMVHNKLDKTTQETVDEIDAMDEGIRKDFLSAVLTKMEDIVKNKSFQGHILSLETLFSKIECSFMILHGAEIRQIGNQKNTAVSL